MAIQSIDNLLGVSRTIKNIRFLYPRPREPKEFLNESWHMDLIVSRYNSSLDLLWGEYIAPKTNSLGFFFAN
jgi:hypothetical protein